MFNLQVLSRIIISKHLKTIFNSHKIKNNVSEKKNYGSIKVLI